MWEEFERQRPVIALDTNILVRYLVERRPGAGPSSQNADRNRPDVRATTVLLETEWVLRSIYGFDRRAIAAGITSLLGLPGMEIEDRPTAAPRA